MYFPKNGREWDLTDLQIGGQTETSEGARERYMFTS